MRKKVLALGIVFITILFIAISCKKAAPVANGNKPHALSNVFYFSGLIDTTWVYQGNDYREECQTSGSVCADFLTYSPASALIPVKFNLIDSANPNPQDTTMLTWVGKTFVAASDSTASHAYLFTFDYPDASGRIMSSVDVPYNIGAKLTVDSVVYDGLSQYYFNTSTGSPVPYTSYRIKGTLTCKVTHFGDSVLHTVKQGLFSINVIEAQ
jgi:hypothetical protein